MHYLRKSALSSSVPSYPLGYREAKFIYCFKQGISYVPMSEIYTSRIKFQGGANIWTLFKVDLSDFHNNESNQIIGLATS